MMFSVRDSSVIKYDFAVQHKGTYIDSSPFIRLIPPLMWMMYIQGFYDKENKKGVRV